MLLIEICDYQTHKRETFPRQGWTEGSKYGSNITWIEIELKVDSKILRGLCTDDMIS